MDQITQTLGFDASQCFAELTKLDGAMVTFENRLKSTATSFSPFNTQAGKTVNAFIQLSKQGTAAASAIAAVAAAQGNLAPGANAQVAASAAAQLATSLQTAGVTGQSASVKIGNALVRIGNQSQQTAQQVQDSSLRMTTSLQLLSRIVFTQFIVRALSQLRNAFRQTTQEAIDFQRQLALIRTIDSSGASLQTLSDSVREIADNLNVPLLDVAAGAYQAISNQVGEFAESLELTAKATEFARSTGSTVADSVDLISGALKAYQLDLSETDRVASVFFKTVDLGRISASELANSFGRVGPVAAELGLTLEELNGSLAAITVRGSKTSEALTQVRAITTALLKPSKSMAETLAAMGFSSGESAIKTLGLAGTLSALEGATEGSVSQMAKLFPNVRGLAGVASLTGDDLKSLTNNIREMESVSKDFANEKFLQATATDAERVTSEINKLKSAFTVDLGQALLKTIANFSDLAGGADALVPYIKSADQLIVGMGISLTALATAFTTARLAGVGFAGALSGLLLVPAAAGLGESIGAAINNRLAEARDKNLRAVEKANEAELKSFNDGLKEKRDAANNADQDRLKATRLVFQELNKIYLTDVANARKANEQMVDSATAGLDTILKARQGLVEALAKASQDATEFQGDSGRRIGDVQGRQDDRDFGRKLEGLDTAQKVIALSNRALQTAQQATNLLNEGSMLGDPQKIDDAIRLFDKAQSIGEDALSTAGDSRELQNRAYRDLTKITGTQISAEQRLIQVQEQRKKAIEAERKAQQAITDELKKQVKIALENTGEFDEKGDRFSVEEQVKREAARQDALKKIAESAISQDGLSAAGALGVASFVQQFQSELSKSPLQVAFDINEASEKIKADLNKAFANFKLKAGIDIEGLSEAVGRDLITPEQVDSALEEVTKLAAETRQKIDDALALGPAGDNLQKEIDTILAGIESRTAKRDSFQGDFSDGIREQFGSLIELMGQVQEDGQITKEELTEVIAKRNELGQAALNGENPLVGKLGFASDIEAIDQILIKFQKYQELQKQQGEVDPALTEQLNRYNAVLQQNPAGQFQGAQQAMANSVGSAQSIASAWERAAKAAERTARAAASGGGSAPTNAAFGGMMHLAGGGFAPRGVDTIPAMLSPGEFVMNARSSRQFFSQLQSMNAGQRPAYRESGGSVTSIGDINVSVNGGPTDKQSLDNIGRGLRRDIRRGLLEL